MRLLFAYLKGDIKGKDETHKRKKMITLCFSIPQLVLLSHLSSAHIFSFTINCHMLNFTRTKIMPLQIPWIGRNFVHDIFLKWCRIWGVFCSSFPVSITASCFALHFVHLWKRWGHNDPTLYGSFLFCVSFEICNC